MNTFLPRVFKVKIAALSCFTIKEIRALGERDKGQMNGFPLSTCNIYQGLKNIGHNSWTVPQNKINKEESWAHLRGCLELNMDTLQTGNSSLLSAHRRHLVLPAQLWEVGEKTKTTDPLF